MLKVKFHDATKLSPAEVLLYFCTVQKSKFNFHHRNYSKASEKLKPVKVAYSSYETTDKTQLDDKVRNPAIIMHGLLGSKNNWNSLSKTIHSRTQHKVIAIDARNHGDSPHTPEFTYPHLVEDIHRLMKDLSIPRINAIGHSLGGRTMMYFALKYPHLVNSLVVVDISPIRTSPAILEMNQLFNAMLMVKLKDNIPLSKARKDVDAQLAEVIPDVYIRQFLLTNLVELEGGTYKWRVNLESLMTNFSAVVNFKPPQTTYKGPVLFIGGSKSSYLRSEDHKDIQKIFPRAEFKYVDGAGHWVHSEKPAEFLDLVCDFLKKNA
ncbi:sn-1-specific diacylglycerol lipase ABHD11-like [Planococcus citri]|uniref:sn-1-specific diacylglycerol lipase ABHD11-like n=1 Tax=Planococcus citri TaxID=170843 RepID=UPI0031F87020